MRTRPCEAVTRRGRMRKAEAFLTAAELSSLDDDLRDPAVTLFVHAGVAAADVICCARLGSHARGEDHREAVELLRQADAQRAPDLQRLLGLKSRAGYGHDPIGKQDLERAKKNANRLVKAAREV